MKTSNCRCHVGPGTWRHELTKFDPSPESFPGARARTNSSGSTFDFDVLSSHSLPTLLVTYSCALMPFPFNCNQTAYLIPNGLV